MQLLLASYLVTVTLGDDELVREVDRKRALAGEVSPGSEISNSASDPLLAEVRLLDALLAAFISSSESESRAEWPADTGESCMSSYIASLSNPFNLITSSRTAALASFF